jgi:hypothetical protein
MRWKTTSLSGFVCLEDNQNLVTEWFEDRLEAAKSGISRKFTQVYRSVFLKTKEKPSLHANFSVMFEETNNSIVKDGLSTLR